MRCIATSHCRSEVTPLFREQERQPMPTASSKRADMAAQTAAFAYNSCMSRFSTRR